jgi:hypothetical protein
MLTFIHNQTNWYKEKSIALEKVRIEILKQTPNGQYKLALRRERALNIFNSVLDASFAIASICDPAYKDSQHYKTVKAMNESINKLHALDLEFKRNKAYPEGGFRGMKDNQILGYKNGEYANEFIFQPKQTKK